jgi:drug/metabolite transporter (DMT)-like permease
MLIGAVVLALFARSSFPRLRQLTLHDWAIIALIAIFGMFGFSALMLYGMKHTSATTGAIVMSTTPAVTALSSIVFMHDKLTWRKVAAIALAVAGVMALKAGQENAGGENPFFGSLLVFGAVCCEAAYTLLGKIIAERVDPIFAAALAAGIALPIFIPFAIWQWQGFDIGAVPASAWCALIWYGGGTLALGTWLWYSGIAKTEGMTAAAFMGVMPMSALILSYFLVGESFHWVHLVGFATVFAGVMLITWEHTRMGKP